ncbi:nuclear protein [Coprinopsis cinerea okayama7|uniref:Nuclear protein n=1 Tax=Coprinopsis cinerea (strain Okayama-7 / 130 / ATCC MYA-4618 / FGSC 9003) TaxID=240176 RepID=A8NXM6_COPC7|nr:nuclear protein [Coprinopsis cinerea okayama7\|eukprot:XP_001837212.2 nuclear protein [Coprinopsis cinerea okayama7\
MTPSGVTSSSKRKKPDDDSANGVSTKKQRTRVRVPVRVPGPTAACLSSFTIQCVARKVPELCKAYTPGKADQDLSARISRLEQIIEVALPQYWNPTAHARTSSTPAAVENNSFRERRRSPSVPDDDTRSQTEEQDPSGGTLQSGKWYGNSASGSVAPAYVIEQLQQVVAHSGSNVRPGFRTGEFDNLEGGSQQRASMKLRPNGEVTDDDAEASPENNLQSLFLECGVSPHQISELHQELPSPQVCDRLIDHYFAAINWTRYPISERDFRAAYTSVLSHIQDGIGATNPHDVRFLPLLFVVLAISVRLAPESLAGDPRTRRVTSLRYYWSSRRSLLIAAAIQPDSLDVVLTRLLSARFLTFDRRITECWSQLGAAVRTAQALGFHRDGSTLGMDPSQTEYRRRVWSYLLHADRSYALVLGRPNSIQDDYTSTKAPSNVDDDLRPGNLESRPLSQPTRMTFVILRHQLAIIIGRIVHHFQQVKERSQYSEVLALDDELLKFMENLPPHFSLQPDTSLDQTHTYIPVHRFLLITEILFVRISLHRPYLLRRLRSDRYHRSRKACFESAIKDFQVRQAFRESMPKERRDSLSNAYREFQTAMISGLYFILEPKGAYSDTMRKILEGFVKEHENMQDLDETTRRELKTIEFLKAKASEMAMQENDPARASSTLTKQEQQAQLLLNLQSPGGSKAFQSLPGSTDQTNATPPFSAATITQLNLSPTFQRLQTNDYANSPTAGSGSPHGDDESPAQSLLDHWVNTVSNTHLDINTGAMSWGGPTAHTDFSGWATAATTVPTDLRGLAGVDGSDWSYWEALVTQIQRAP